MITQLEMIPEYDLPVLEQKAIGLLQLHQPKDRPYWGCFSGGKDSVVIKELAKRAGVNVEWHYNVTTIDPPELVRFIRKHHQDVAFDRPPRPFFVVVRERGIPTRRARWCCEEFKESRNPEGARLILGIRAHESARRRKAWKQVSVHRSTRSHAILPILFWRDEQVWGYIRGEGLSYCSLYDEGFKRLGCIGCPAANREKCKKEFIRWPQYEKLWKKATKETWERRTGSKQKDARRWFGDKFFKTWEELWDWWLNDDPLPHEETCQGSLDLS